MSFLKIATVFNVDLDFQLAPLGKRISAYFIDFFIIITYTIIASNIIFEIFKDDDIFNIYHFFRDYSDYDESTKNSGIAFLIYFFIVSVPAFCYSLFMEMYNSGQTIGKMLMQIKVISIDGQPTKSWQLVIRWLFKIYEWYIIFDAFFLFYLDDLSGFSKYIFWIFSTCTVGMFALIIAALNSNYQRLGDLFGGTVVVNTQIKIGLSDTIFKQVTTENYNVVFPNVLKLSDKDINTINNILSTARKSGNYELVNKVAQKVEQVLGSKTNMYADAFLEKVLEDYNYLATQNK